MLSAIEGRIFLFAVYVFILLAGAAYGDLTGHTEAEVDSLLTDLDADRDGDLADETPLVTGINIGNADTSIVREGAGDITVGGNHVYRAGGTDVADGDVADNITITNISQVADISATASEINTPLDGATVTLPEFQQLQTIGASTMSAAQWAGLGGATTAGIALWDDAAASNQRTTLGLVIGTNVQAYNSVLTTYAGIDPAANIQSFLGAADYAAAIELLGVGVTDSPTFAGVTITASPAPGCTMNDSDDAAGTGSIMANSSGGANGVVLSLGVEEAAGAENTAYFRMDGILKTMEMDKSLYIYEQAEATADKAAYGQIWVNTATPNELWFTDDAGNDTELGVGGGASVVFDIGDDGGNDSIDVGEIATTGDTNGVFSESAADKILIAVGNNWPTSDLAGTVTVVDSTYAGDYVALVGAATGSLPVKTDTGITYDATSGTLSATAFSGPLTGNVTGDASGSSGTCDGLAASATILATARTIGGVSFNGSANIVPAQLTLDDETSVDIMGDADGMDDAEYNGIVVSGLDAGEAIGQWDVVFIEDDTDPIWEADATAASTEYPAFGIAVAAASDTNPVIILTQGIVRLDSWDWTPGAPIYLGEADGTLTATAPSTENDCVQIIGWAVSDDEIYFDFSRPYQLVE